MKNLHLTRLLYTFLCLIAAVSFPYILTLFLILIGFILFDDYVEGIVSMIISDIVFGTPLTHFHSLIFIGTVFAFVSFALVAYVKSLTRLHEYI